MAACGIAGEDDDGNAASRQKPTVDVEVAVKAIQSAVDLDSLKTHFSGAVKLFKGDAEAFAKVNAAKDARKAELLAKVAE
jgi:hypothetical protein